MSDLRTVDSAGCVEDPAFAGPPGEPFKILLRLWGDAQMSTIFSEERTIRGWCETEAALARAQAACGVLPDSIARQVSAACLGAQIDRARLWADAANVGYPILGLVRQIAESLDGEAAGRVHWGATTQDIMDTALALQLGAAGDRIIQILSEFGDALASLAERHTNTVMAARTHAQQAVPTTFGAKVAVFLAQVDRDRDRVGRALSEVRTVSLFGAGGTSAAMGPESRRVRREMALSLGLAVDNVPWHVARDRILELALACSISATTAVRFAREIVDLARTEVAEVEEVPGHHRGASSTMPQKRNPITSEAVVGLGLYAAGMSSSLMRVAEAGHERAAGEWQLEWMLLPELFCSAGSALARAAELASTVEVDSARMRLNLEAQGGLVMAEAYMMRLGQGLGREFAHDVVYAAAQLARASGTPLLTALRSECERLGVESPVHEVSPADYLGESQSIVDEALSRWNQSRTSFPIVRRDPR